MSSFKRRLPSSAVPLPPGTIPHPSVPQLPLISTGIPSLDDILGLGLPLATLLLILAPDGHSSWGKLISRYFIAQGLASDQDVVVVSGEEQDAMELVAGCMWLDSSVARARAAEERVAQVNEKYQASMAAEQEDDSDAEGLVEEDSNRTKIAWRYMGMKKVEMGLERGSEKRVALASSFSHALNLTTTIPADFIETSSASGRLSHLSISGPSSNTTASPLASSSSYAPLARILQQLRHLLQSKGVLSDELGGGLADGIKKENKVVRVLIHEMGSLDWGDNITSIHIHRFLHSLRSMIRGTTVSIMLTFPPHLARGTPVAQEGEGKREWVERLARAGDACVEFQGFASDPSLPLSFPNLHALVHPYALPAPLTLIPAAFRHSQLLGLGNTSSGQENLGARVKRKRVVIERVGLGVEGGVGERRTEPKGSGVVAVGGVEHVHGPECGHEGLEKVGRAVAVEVEVEGIDGIEDEVETGKGKEVGETLQLGGGRKKGREKKQVAFGGVRHDRMDLYEF